MSEGTQRAVLVAALVIYLGIAAFVLIDDYRSHQAARGRWYPEGAEAEEASGVKLVDQPGAG